MLKFENVLNNYFFIKELLVQTYVRRSVTCVQTSPPSVWSGSN